MSKQIDWNAPVSEKDKEWAAQFPSLHGGTLEANASQFPAETEETLDGADDEELPYPEWTVAELQTEIRRRNAEENKSLPVPGKKSEAVKVLETDDETEEQPPA